MLRPKFLEPVCLSALLRVCTLGHALKLGSKLPSPFFFFFCCRGSVVLVDLLGMFSQRSNAPSLCLSADSPPGFGTPPLLHCLPTKHGSRQTCRRSSPRSPLKLSRPCLLGPFVFSAESGFSPGVGDFPTYTGTPLLVSLALPHT